MAFQGLLPLSLLVIVGMPVRDFILFNQEVVTSQELSVRNFNMHFMHLSLYKMMLLSPKLYS